MANEKEIRYFSMFTGVGGFELGFEGVGKDKPLREDSGLYRSEFDSPLPKDKQCTSYLPKTSRSEQRRDERDSSESEQVGLAPKQFTCVGVSEIDKYSSELLKQKFPSVKNWGDATKINSSELPDFDMLCGGFPCQAFSIAGKRRGFNDTRGTLFFDIARVLEVKRPKIVLLENVKGLLNHNKGKTFRTILQTLSELGYDVQWMVLNSKFFGVPQNRERVFIIGSLRGTSQPEILPLTGGNGETKDLVYVQKSDREIARVYDPKGIAPTIHLKTGGWQEPKVVMDLYNKKEHSDRSPTLTEPHHNTLRVREGMKIRRLTPTECERLQGFPDGWTEGFSDTQRYKMMGNAVTVNVIRAIASKLKNDTKQITLGGKTK